MRYELRHRYNGSGADYARYAVDGGVVHLTNLATKNTGEMALEWIDPDHVRIRIAEDTLELARIEDAQLWSYVASDAE
jgi:hypothetical protein